MYRELLAVYKGRSPEICALFGLASTEEELWGRHYMFWHKGRPLALIYEVFSPALEAYLGPRVVPMVEAKHPAS